jgi:hypothetical protein
MQEQVNKLVWLTIRNGTGKHEDQGIFSFFSRGRLWASFPQKISLKSMQFPQKVTLHLHNLHNLFINQKLLTILNICGNDKKNSR